MLHLQDLEGQTTALTDITYIFKIKECQIKQIKKIKKRARSQNGYWKTEVLSYSLTLEVRSHINDRNVARPQITGQVIYRYSPGSPRPSSDRGSGCYSISTVLTSWLCLMTSRALTLLTYWLRLRSEENTWFYNLGVSVILAELYYYEIFLVNYNLVLSIHSLSMWFYSLFCCCQIKDNALLILREYHTNLDVIISVSTPFQWSASLNVFLCAEIHISSTLLPRNFFSYGNCKSVWRFSQSSLQYSQNQTMSRH